MRTLRKLFTRYSNDNFYWTCSPMTGGRIFCKTCNRELKNDEVKIIYNSDNWYNKTFTHGKAECNKCGLKYKWSDKKG